MLFLGPYWPDPAATGAGVRTAFLLGAFRRWGYGAVAFASPQLLAETGLEEKAWRAAELHPSRPVVHGVCCEVIAAWANEFFPVSVLCAP